MSATRNVLTREEVHALAQALTTAAADMIGRQVELGELRGGAAEQEARERVARWLQYLPGDGWDRRLPDPKSLPALDRRPAPRKLIEVLP